MNCPSCRSPLPPEALNTADLIPCPSCNTRIQGLTFPALLRPSEPSRQAEIIVSDEQASCFYHPQKKAVVPCDYCGRFLCALCDIDFSGKHYCSGCIESARQRKTMQQFENKRTLYDQIALSLAILPLLVCQFALFITAPLALYLSLKHWKDPGSLVRKNKARLLFAILFSILEIAGIVIIVVLMITQWPRGQFR